MNVKRSDRLTDCQQGRTSYLVLRVLKGNTPLLSMKMAGFTGWMTAKRQVRN